jgi:hypothetical protein
MGTLRRPWLERHREERSVHRERRPATVRQPPAAHAPRQKDYVRRPFLPMPSRLTASDGRMYRRAASD